MLSQRKWPFVDLILYCRLHLYYIYCAFVYLYSEEAQEYIEMGTLNGLFVLGRTMGFIGEYNCTNVL